MKTKFLSLLVALPLLFSACTDLDETYYNEIDPEKIPVDQKIASVYLNLKGSMTGFPETCPWWKLVYAVQTSTDEICVPMQNATDWYDGGIYLQMQSHTWSPSNTILWGSWNYLYNIISNCNVILVRYESDLTNEGRAEMQTLRAYAYYRLMDLFGNVPLMTEKNFDQPQMPQNTSRAELFKWVENQLTYIEGTEYKVEDYLKDKKYAKMTKGVLNTLKARLYLNSKVFLSLDDESAEYAEYLKKAIEACDAVISSGAYTLESNIYANWYVDNGPRSPEIIFAIPFLGDGSAEGNRLSIETLTGPGPAMALAFGNEMYSHATSGWHVNPGIDPANGQGGIFELFNEKDNRRLSILYGQTYDRKKYADEKVFEKITLGDWTVGDPDSPNPASRREKVYLNYATWFKNRGFDPAGYNDSKLNLPKAMGARIIKFELLDNPQFYESPVDMVVMRYAEVLYTKAEALIRLHRNAEAVPLFKEVLQNRGFDPMSDANYTKEYPFRDMDTDVAGNETVEKISAVALMSKRWLTGRTTDLTKDMPVPASPDLSFMDDEWRREFIFEDRRRTDMIRMNKFVTGTWGGKLTPTNDPNRNLFPIPQSIMNANPELVQNPGY